MSRTHEQHSPEVDLTYDFLESRLLDVFKMETDNYLKQCGTEGYGVLARDKASVIVLKGGAGLRGRLVAYSCTNFLALWKIQMACPSIFQVLFM